METKQEQQEQIAQLKKKVESLNIEIAEKIAQRIQIQHNIQEIAVEIVTGGVFDKGG
jgi:chromosome segregation ATPase